MLLCCSSRDCLVDGEAAAACNGCTVHTTYDYPCIPLPLTLLNMAVLSDKRQLWCRTRPSLPSRKGMPHSSTNSSRKPGQQRPLDQTLSLFGCSLVLNIILWVCLICLMLFQLPLAGIASHFMVFKERVTICHTSFKNNVWSQHCFAKVKSQAFVTRVCSSVRTRKASLPRVSHFLFYFFLTL